MAPESSVPKRKRGRPSNASKLDIDASQERNDATEAYDTDAPNQMRPKKRGRPRKSVGSPDDEASPAPESSKVAKKRGRPSLGGKARDLGQMHVHQDEATPPQQKRKRGRPSLKSREPEDEETPRRGRPRYSEDTESQTSLQSSGAAQESDEDQLQNETPNLKQLPAKRKRGRPSLQARREEEETPERGPPKGKQEAKPRKRGRPSLRDISAPNEMRSRPSENAKGKTATDSPSNTAPGRRRGRPPGSARVSTGATMEDSPDPSARRALASENEPAGDAPVSKKKQRRPHQDADAEDDDDVPPSPSKPYPHISPHINRVRQSTIESKWSPLPDSTVSAASSMLALAHRPILQRLSTSEQHHTHTSAALRLVSHRITRKIARGIPFPPASMPSARVPRGRQAGIVPGAAGVSDGRATELDFESVLDAKTALERQLDPALHAVELLAREKEKLERELDKVHVQHSLRYTDWRIYKWFKSQTGSFYFHKKEEHIEGLGTIWKHRKDLIEQLQSWLDGSSDTFIVVTGPRGSGKAEMVMSQTLSGRKNVVLIDCKPITEANGEAGTIKRLAAAVGYRPVFSWANSISSMIDLAVQGTTGVKSGFSETLESQLNKILHTTATALKNVALSERHKTDKDATISEDAYLEAHPEQRPIIVVDNFLHKNEDSSIVYDMIAEWAATVVQNNIAHVVFLTSDSAYSKSLTKAMPDRVFRTLSLGDLDADVAKNFVVTRLEEDLKREAQEQEEQGEENKKVPPRPSLAGLDDGIKVLGGRLTDLEFLARRLKAGQTPHEAVEEIVTEDATDIAKMYLLGRTADADRRWSIEQAWHLIKALSENPTLRYHQVLLSPTFASSLSSNATNGEAAIESLAGAELITVKTHRGRPQTIEAGKPLHQAAFGVLVKDRVLRAKMDLAVLTEMAKVEAKNIDTVEKELQLLGGLPRHTGESAGRVMYLLSKLDAGQRKIAQFEKEMGGLKKILNEEY